VEMTTAVLAQHYTVLKCGCGGYADTNPHEAKSSRRRRQWALALLDSRCRCSLAGDDHSYLPGIDFTR